MRYVGREQIDRDEVDVVEIAPADARGITWRYFISTDRIVRRVVASAQGTEGQPMTRWAQLDNPRINHHIADETFQWKPSGRTLGLGDLGVDLSAGRRAK